MNILLDTAYIPPIQYFIALAATCGRCNFSLRADAPAGGTAYIEACENYQKQSYRNRCNFYAASGQQSLSVPVAHEGGTQSIPITQVRIDYSKAWLQQHERAIISAYRTSAFFEYYQDEFFSILDSRPETLWELNLSLTRFFLDKLGLPVELRTTESFTISDSVCPDGPWAGLPFNRNLNCLDLREVIHPKRPDDILGRMQLKKPYFQVFACKHGFIPNLSVVDLLFNEGPNSLEFLSI